MTDAANYIVDSRNRDRDHGQFSAHSLASAHFIIPILHILMGIVNEFLKKLEKKVGKGVVISQIYQPLGITGSSYHGGNLGWFLNYPFSLFVYFRDIE